MSVGLEKMFLFSELNYPPAGLRIRMDMIRIRPSRNTGSGSDRQEISDPDPTIKKKIRLRAFLNSGSAPPALWATLLKYSISRSELDEYFIFWSFIIIFFVVVVIFSQYIVISYNFDNSHHVIKNLHCCC